MNQLSAESRTITTTTLVLEQPIDYSLIEKIYRVERYIVPSSLQYNNNPTNYGRVHNAFRDQVNHPYRSYMHDKLDGDKNKKWVFYVLYPKAAETIDVTLPWFQNALLQRKTVSFRDLPPHMFLKLLQIRFFRGDGEKRFVGHDKCYVYARSDDKNDIHTCVEIEIKEAITNRETSSSQEFRVIPHARRLGKAEQPYYPADPLFGKHIEGKQSFFIHLRSSALEKEKTVYKLVNFKNSRAQLKYHDPNNLDAGRGKIVLDFLQAFLSNLADLGIMGHLQTRLVKPAPPPEAALLPVSQLNTVGVFDNRLNRTQSLSDYIDLFNTLPSSVRFIPVDDITHAPQSGIIVLLDAKAEDFADGGILSQYEDPYPLLYGNHPEIPKHSLNVNTNDPDALDGGDYLDYSMLQPDDGNFQRKIDVILSELYLKCSIIHGQDTFPLPLIPNEMAFIRRDNYNSQKRTVALWFEDNHIHFANLDDPPKSEAFYNLAVKWGVDWDVRYEMLLAERRRFTESGTNKYKDLPSFDIIIGRNLFVAIDDLEESVLYDYEEISRRQQEQKKPYPISYFRLSPHYDQIQKQRLNLLTLDQLSQQGLLDGSRDPKTNKSRTSLNFYKRLLEYDALLEEIEVTHPSLSYRELISGEWLERIAKIFGSKKSKDRKYRGKIIEGKYHSKLITGIYQDLDKFLSQKGKDVHLYQGIWYDDTDAFIVGSPNSMNIEGQERAHPIRRFQILQGKEHFDKEQLLLTMGVQFVRHKQYTVSPYYFHLIDLYIENVLQYSFPT